MQRSKIDELTQDLTQSKRGFFDSLIKLVRSGESCIVQTWRTGDQHPIASMGVMFKINAPYDFICLNYMVFFAARLERAALGETASVLNFNLPSNEPTNTDWKAIKLLYSDTLKDRPNKRDSISRRIELFLI